MGEATCFEVADRLPVRGGHKIQVQGIVSRDGINGGHQEISGIAFLSISAQVGQL